MTISVTAVTLQSPIDVITTLADNTDTTEVTTSPSSGRLCREIERAGRQEIDTKAGRQVSDGIARHRERRCPEGVSEGRPAMRGHAWRSDVGSIVCTHSKSSMSCESIISVGHTM